MPEDYGTVAYIIHPKTPMDYAIFDPSLNVMNEQEMQSIAEQLNFLLESFVLCKQGNQFNNTW